MSREMYVVRRWEEDGNGEKGEKWRKRDKGITELYRMKDMYSCAIIHVLAER